MDPDPSHSPKNKIVSWEVCPIALKPGQTSWKRRKCDAAKERYSTFKAFGA